MKSNNRGFTLMELIVSVAILGIMTVITVGFLHSGTKMHSSVSGQVNIQFQSQLAMNHIREYVVDAATAISFESVTGYATLCIINEDEEDSNKYFAHVFEFEENNKEIFYLYFEGILDEEVITLDDVNAKVKELLTDSVESFQVTLVEDTENKGEYTENKVDIATVSINFLARGKSYDGKMEIALRNKPFNRRIERTRS